MSALKPHDDPYLGSARGDASCPPCCGPEKPDRACDPESCDLSPSGEAYLRVLLRKLSLPPFGFLVAIADTLRFLRDLLRLSPEAFCLLVVSLALLEILLGGCGHLSREGCVETRRGAGPFVAPPGSGWLEGKVRGLQPQTASAD